MPAAVLLVPFLVLAVAVRGGLLPGDEALSLGLAPYRAGLLAVVNQLASVQVWTILVLLGGLALWLLHMRYAAVLLVLADLSGELVGLVAKTIVSRPRPPGAHLADIIATHSFPSGHVMRTMVTLIALVAVVAWRRPSWRWPAAGGAAAFLFVLGIGRIASGEHWPSDVLGAYLLAGVWADILLVGAWYVGETRGLR
ncbi:MAG: phosphatase PAP2 family protein [Chloroflexi bacterium]|nr:phosphatase PAP2 family protein [Chloroflexota bacterium]